MTLLAFAVPLYTHNTHSRPNTFLNTTSFVIPLTKSQNNKSSTHITRLNIWSNLSLLINYHPDLGHWYPQLSWKNNPVNRSRDQNHTWFSTPERLYFQRTRLAIAVIWSIRTTYHRFIPHKPYDSKPIQKVIITLIPKKTPPKDTFRDDIE